MNLRFKFLRCLSTSIFWVFRVQTVWAIIKKSTHRCYKFVLFTFLYLLVSSCWWAVIRRCVICWNNSICDLNWWRSACKPFCSRNCTSNTSAVWPTGSMSENFISIRCSHASNSSLFCSKFSSFFCIFALKTCTSCDPAFWRFDRFHRVPRWATTPIFDLWDPCTNQCLSLPGLMTAHLPFSSVSFAPTSPGALLLCTGCRQ